MKHTVDPDLDLVVACQQSAPPISSELFRLLHDRHKDIVHRICLRITGDAHDALDAAQDAFLLAYRGIRGFRFESRFSRWLCGIATHASIELWRRHDTHALSEREELDLGAALGRSLDPCSAAEARERRRHIRRALCRLSPHLREILVLRYFEGLSYPELETRLGIARGSVRSRLHRAHSASSWVLLALEDEIDHEGPPSRRSPGSDPADARVDFVRDLAAEGSGASRHRVSTA